MPKRKHKTGRISVFKGRKAKFNHLIFRTLALRSPQTIWDIYKVIKAKRGLMHVRYASINKRVRALEESGYIQKVGVKISQAGSESTLYEPTARAYLALLLNKISLNHFIEETDDDAIFPTLTALISAAKLLSPDEKVK